MSAGLEWLDALWGELSVIEQAPLVRRLAQRVEVGAAGADIRLRVEGLTSLLHDLAARVAECQAAETEGPSERRFVSCRRVVTGTIRVFLWVGQRFAAAGILRRLTLRDPSTSAKPSAATSSSRGCRSSLLQRHGCVFWTHRRTPRANPGARCLEPAAWVPGGSSAPTASTVRIPSHCAGRKRRKRCRRPAHPRRYDLARRRSTIERSWA